MTASLFDLRNVPHQSPDDYVGLQAALAQVVGEPFRFARVSYGDELTLHFGDLRPARSPKLHRQPYGALILGMRGSPWVLKAGSEPLVLTAGALPEFVPAKFGKPLSNEELESKQFVEPESRVVLATPFIVKPVNGFGLQLRLSDGSSLLVLPTAHEPDDEKDEALPELADWELLTPRGLLSVGPGLKWSFKPATGPVPPLNK
jgi:hypothetical protein